MLVLVVGGEGRQIAQEPASRAFFCQEVGGRDQGAGEGERVEVEFAWREGDERWGEEEHDQRGVVEEGVVGRCHCFALGGRWFSHFWVEGGRKDPYRVCVVRWVSDGRGGTRDGVVDSVWLGGVDGNAGRVVGIVQVRSMMWVS